MEKLNCIHDNNDNSNRDIFIAEYNVIKNELSSLFQKAGIILAINTMLVGIILTISGGLASFYHNNLYLILLLLLAIPVSSSALIIKILIPRLKPANRSKYFNDYANLENIEELNGLITLENIKEQIIVNSKILKEKYNLYKWSIFCLCFPISITFLKCFITKRNNHERETN